MANLKCIALFSVFVFLVLLLVCYSNQVLSIAFRGSVDNLPKIKSSPKEWDDIPITHFYIRASHNSFTGASMQVLSEASPKAIINALDLGARSIEIDVGLDRNGKCVVGHKGLKPGTFSTTTVSFEDMLQLIAENAFKQIDDPLFLHIDNSSDPTNMSLATQMHEVITRKLGNYLERNEIPLQHKPLKELRNKILLMGNSIYPTLNDIMYNYTNRGSKTSKAQELQTNSGMSRVWPQHISSVFSVNVNAIPFMKNNFQLVAMNFGQYDHNLLTYLKQFGEYALKPIHPILLNYPRAI